MVLLQRVETKVLRMTRYSILMRKKKITNKKQKQNEIVQILDFFFEMSFDTPAFKVLVFASLNFELK